MVYHGLKIPESPLHYCHRCGAWVPDDKEFCPQCGACANCGLLEAESPQPKAPHAFCPNCGNRLRLKRPAQGMALLLWRILWGLSIGVLTLIASAAALFGTCAVFFVGSGGAAAVLWLLGAVGVFGMSVWIIMLLSSKRP